MRCSFYYQETFTLTLMPICHALIHTAIFLFTLFNAPTSAAPQIPLVRRTLGLKPRLPYCNTSHCWSDALTSWLHDLIHTLYIILWKKPQPAVKVKNCFIMHDRVIFLNLRKPGQHIKFCVKKMLLYQSVNRFGSTYTLVSTSLST